MTESRRRYAVWMAVILITVVAATVRFSGLGDLGFFGDEETTSYAARSLAEGHGAAMPSGMPYRRALPITWLSAIVARHVGLEAEVAYRVVPALLGTLAVPLIFLAGKHFAGTGAGIISALLLALSGWHLIWSRTARMYAPLVTALVAFFYLILKWKETGQSRYLAGAATMYFVGALLHRAGVAVVLFPIVLATMRNGDRVNARNAIVVATLLGLAGLLLGGLFIGRPFDLWANVRESLPMAGAQASNISQMAMWALGLLGGIVGAVWAHRADAKLPEGTEISLRIALAITATLCVAAVFMGYLWTSITLSICWLVMVRVVESKQRILPPWILIATMATGALLGSVLRLAEGDWSWRAIAFTPFPYLPYLGTLLPLTIILFFLTSAGLIFLRPRYGDQALRASVIFVLIYALLLGFDVPYAPWRYLFPMYPWILLTVAAGIWWMAEVVVSRFSKISSPAALVAISLAVLAGGIGGHGIPAARRVLEVSYGERVPWHDQGMIGRPDHKGAGLFVRESLEPGDLVIAEDPLQQRWYVGRVDYWLRSFADASPYLNRNERGSLHDIYVWSELMADPPDSDWLQRPDRSVWLITSLETARRRDLYLSVDQRRWLEEIEAAYNPAHMGRDGQTAVYCFGACQTESSDRQPDSGPATEGNPGLSP